MHPGPGDLGGWKDLRVPTPLNSRPDLQAVISVMVVGNGQDTTSPQAIRKTEIRVGEVGQPCAHEVDEAAPTDGRDLETQDTAGLLKLAHTPLIKPEDQRTLMVQLGEEHMRFIKQSKITRTSLMLAAQIEDLQSAWVGP